MKANKTKTHFEVPLLTNGTTTILHILSTFLNKNLLITSVQDYFRDLRLFLNLFSRINVQMTLNACRQVTGQNSHLDVSRKSQSQHDRNVLTLL